MHLSPHSLRQIDDADLKSLEEEALRELSMRLLADLKEAWDRLNQGPDNSSRPPSSRAPWERKNGGGRESDADAEAADGAHEPVPAEAQPTEAQPTPTPAARKPNKQRGAPPKGPGSAGFPALRSSCVSCTRFSKSVIGPPKRWPRASRR